MVSKTKSLGSNPSGSAKHGESGEIGSHAGLWPQCPIYWTCEFESRLSPYYALVAELVQATGCKPVDAGSSPVKSLYRCTGTSVCTTVSKTVLFNELGGSNPSTSVNDLIGKLVKSLDCKSRGPGSIPGEVLKRITIMAHPLKYRKMSKSDATEPSNIVITDEIRINALQNELNYWKMRYILAEKYGFNRA